MYGEFSLSPHLRLVRNKLFTHKLTCASHDVSLIRLV
jgi:hypothetical protein